MSREETAKTYAWFDPVLIPTKRFVFTNVCRGDYERYLALRARAAIMASGLRLYDRRTLSYVRTIVRRGDTVIDVGANFGAYAAALAKMVGSTGRVDAFEPQPDVFACLQQMLGNRPHVNLLESALGASVGSGRIRIPTIAHGAVPEPALAHLALDDPTTQDAGEGEFDVSITTIDAHCAAFESLRYLKVDAEGTDLDVLRGGVETITRLRPFAQFECAEDDELPPFAAFANEIGYLPPRRIGELNFIIAPK
jgi:FkbM family methyltransferase